MINGVELDSLKIHPDERGYFREILRFNSLNSEEKIGQVSHSLVYTGVIKAWHAHKYQTQWNYVSSGLIYVALYDNRNDSITRGKTMKFMVGENHETKFYRFPPGVLHGYKCLNGPMNIIYITSGIYDIDDEIRIPHDDNSIGFNWINPFDIK
jgi:dTDP-4-dehydrorhamnose 3,5-epimerase